MVEQHGSDTAFTTPDEHRRLRQLLDEDAIRNLALRYSHYLDHQLSRATERGVHARHRV